MPCSRVQQRRHYHGSWRALTGSLDPSAKRAICELRQRKRRAPRSGTALGRDCWWALDLLARSGAAETVRDTVKDDEEEGNNGRCGANRQTLVLGSETEATDVTPISLGP
ncbi:hypothetical protein HGRIS_001592 [Hohenbuehelia grisea]|uniref:Uncharacterized protein n=1 Tax=Hohenbuehelia grisea TaxID=104357 RepID=A0ABR3JJ46_9AGAR